MGLVIGCSILGCIVFVIRKQMRKQYVSKRTVDDDDDVALAELAKNDGMKLVYPTGYVGNDHMMMIKLIVMGLVIGCSILGCIVFVIRKQMRKQYVSKRT